MANLGVWVMPDSLTVFGHVAFGLLLQVMVLGGRSRLRQGKSTLSRNRRLCVARNGEASEREVYGTYKCSSLDIGVSRGHLIRYAPACNSSPAVRREQRLLLERWRHACDISY